MKQRLKNSTNNHYSSDLFLSLRQFGLNPFEWNFIYTDKKTILIENIDSSEIYFEGSIGKNKGRYFWKSISCVSL